VKNLFKILNRLSKNVRKPQAAGGGGVDSHCRYQQHSDFETVLVCNNRLTVETKGIRISKPNSTREKASKWLTVSDKIDEKREL